MLKFCVNIPNEPIDKRQAGVERKKKMIAQLKAYDRRTVYSTQ